jgi:hypothetical protein
VILSERTWRRHANPWSVWTRFAAFPVLIAAVWTYHWIGWWSVAPIAAVVLFLIVNPGLFPPPRSTRNWASMAVLGERVWLAEKRRVLPQQNQMLGHVNIALSLANTAALIWGLISSDALLTIVSGAGVLGCKAWFLDRMVCLFWERKDANSEYASWLY